MLNIKHTENVLHQYFAEINDTGIARASICFFIHENKNVLDCCKKGCGKFATYG